MQEHSFEGEKEMWLQKYSFNWTQKAVFILTGTSLSTLGDIIHIYGEMQHSNPFSPHFSVLLTFTVMEISLQALPGHFFYLNKQTIIFMVTYPQFWESSMSYCIFHRILLVLSCLEHNFCSVYQNLSDSQSLVRSYTSVYFGLTSAQHLLHVVNSNATFLQMWMSPPFLTSTTCQGSQYIHV